jgi:uncharacterized protein
MSQTFTPISALIGGALIGLAAALIWSLLGRIAGASDILGNALTEPGFENGWRIAFLAGLLSAGVGAVLLAPGLVHFDLKAGGSQLLVAGLLVGFGTRTASGCTSGHGICGVGRFSLRSIVATLCFMGSAMLTVFVLGHMG